jgi:hypothetical protein
MPGTAMAEAFQEAGFYEGGYDAEGQPVEEQAQQGEQAQEGEPAQEADAADAGGSAGQAASDDTLENIVEDLKRKNAGE